MWHVIVNYLEYLPSSQTGSRKSWTHPTCLHICGSVLIWRSNGSETRKTIFLSLGSKLKPQWSILFAPWLDVSNRVWYNIRQLMTIRHTRIRARKLKTGKFVLIELALLISRCSKSTSHMKLLIICSWYPSSLRLNDAMVVLEF